MINFKKLTILAILLLFSPLGLKACTYDFNSPFTTQSFRSTGTFLPESITDLKVIQDTRESQYQKWDKEPEQLMNSIWHFKPEGVFIFSDHKGNKLEGGWSQDPKTGVITYSATRTWEFSTQGNEYVAGTYSSLTHKISGEKKGLDLDMEKTYDSSFCCTNLKTSKWQASYKVRIKLRP